MLSLAAVKSFFSFSNWSVYLIIGAVLVYGYFRIESLNTENKMLENEVENIVEKNDRLATELTNFKDKVISDLEAQKGITEKVDASNKRNEKRMNDLYNTFNTSADGSERKLEELSIAKPNLIQIRINKATKKVFDNVQKNSNIDSDK